MYWNFSKSVLISKFRWQYDKTKLSSAVSRTRHWYLRHFGGISPFNRRLVLTFIRLREVYASMSRLASYDIRVYIYDTHRRVDGVPSATTVDGRSPDQSATSAVVTSPKHARACRWRHRLPAERAASQLAARHCSLSRHSLLQRPHNQLRFITSAQGRAQARPKAESGGGYLESWLSATCCLFSSSVIYSVFFQFSILFTYTFKQKPRPADIFTRKTSTGLLVESQDSQ